LKAQIDENLPPSLARAIDAIARVHDHEVVHVRDFVGPGTSDLLLFQSAVERGISVHVTCDNHQRRHAERQSVARLGLTVFVLAKGWRKFDHYETAARLLEWWPKIVNLVEITGPGGIYRISERRASGSRLIPIK
jgi:hypothetical protein